jgi:MoxR-like ATPase
MDRFIFKIVVGYSQLDDLMTILDRTTGAGDARAGAGARRAGDPGGPGPGPRRGRRAAREGVRARLVLATHPGASTPRAGESGPTNRYIRCGASPRAAQALLLGGKVKAVTDGRYHVSYADIRSRAHQSLRHRLHAELRGRGGQHRGSGIEELG